MSLVRIQSSRQNNTSGQEIDRFFCVILYIDIPSPTPPFGKTEASPCLLTLGIVQANLTLPSLTRSLGKTEVSPCLLTLGIVQASLTLPSLTRSLVKGRGLVADSACSELECVGGRLEPFESGHPDTVTQAVKRLTAFLCYYDLEFKKLLVVKKKVQYRGVQEIMQGWRLVCNRKMKIRR